MAYKKEKTDQEWNKIRFTNNLGPQIGGLIKQATDLTIAEWKGQNCDGAINEYDIKEWLDKLYDIAEAKKKELTEPHPMSNEEARQAGIEFNKRIENDSKADDIIKGGRYTTSPAEEFKHIDTALETEQEQLQEEEMGKREDQARKWGEDNKSN